MIKLNDSFNDWIYECHKNIKFVNDLNFTDKEIVENYIKIIEINKVLNECLNNESPYCICENQKHEMFYRDNYGDLKTSFLKCNKKRNSVNDYLINDFDKNNLKLIFGTKNIECNKDLRDSRSILIDELVAQSKSNNFKSLYIYGDIGVGKTYIMSLFCNRILEKNKSIAFVNMLKLLKKFKYTKNYFSISEEFLDSIVKMKEADILVLDEIGIEEYNYKFHIEYILDLLCERYDNDKVTYFLSNHDLKKLKLIYQKSNKFLSADDVSFTNINKFVQQIYKVTNKKEIHLQGINWIEKGR